MSALDDTGGNAPFQVRDLWRWRERFVEDHEQWRRDVDADRRDFKHMANTVENLARTVESLRRVLLGFAITIAVSAVGFALSVLIATGKIGGK